MLNGIFVAIVVLSVVLAAWTGGMEAVTRGSVDAMGSAVELALGLVGVMAFFLGLMKVAQDAGLLRLISRAVAPVLRFLFPSVPRDHPAMSAMIMNIACNMLGLGNAATPFGIKAISELQRLNPRKDTATDAMIVFLAINTSGLSLLPSGVISLRASVGSEDPAGIFFTTWFASGCATVVGVTAALLLSRLPAMRRSAPPVSTGAAAGDSEDAPGETPGSVPDDRPIRPSWVRRIVGAGIVAALLAALVVRVARSAGTVPALDLFTEIASYWVIPLLIVSLVLYGWVRGVKVYESLVEGAREGFQVAVRIIPYLVAILAMAAMFRASGGMKGLVFLIDPVTSTFGLPAEAVPMAILRPLSGSGAYAIAAEIMQRHGADSLIGYMVSTFQGSTETTFYVLAVYFGAVGIKKSRHALPACLMADAAGIAAAVFIVNRLFG